MYDLRSLLLNADIDWMWHYYLANKIWVYGNAVMILPFLIACLNRLFHPHINHKLWTDHLCRVCLTFSVLFYLYETVIKYTVDGGDTICQKGTLIHHISTLFIVSPLIIN